MNSRWIISRVNLIRGDYPGTHIANADTSVTIANTWRAEVTNPEEASPVIELTRLEDAKDVTLSAGCLEYNSFPCVLNGRSFIYFDAQKKMWIVNLTLENESRLATRKREYNSNAPSMPLTPSNGLTTDSGRADGVPM